MADNSGYRNAGDVHEDDNNDDSNEEDVSIRLLSALGGWNQAGEQQQGAQSASFPVDFQQSEFANPFNFRLLDPNDPAAFQQQENIYEDLTDVPMTETHPLHLDTMVDIADDEPTPRVDPIDEESDIPRSGGPTFTQPLERDDVVDDAIALFTRSYSRPVGFHNPNVECYLNSVLAALASSRQLIAYLENWYRRNEDEANSMKRHSLLHRILNVAGTWYRSASQKTVNQVRSHFVENCVIARDGSTPSTSSKWQPWAERAQDRLLMRQQDASEFLAWLLESISGQLARSGGASLGDEAYNMTGAQKRFNALFQFSLTNRLTCTTCSPPVRWRSPRLHGHREYILQLVTPDDSEPRTTLESLIDNYFNDTVSRWRSDECGHLCQNAEQKPRLQSLPSVLFIHAHRTKMSKARTMYKTLSYVRIPERLDMSEYLEPHQFGKGSLAKYRLRAIVSHGHSSVPSRRLPTLNSGHYVSVVRTGIRDNTWYLIDDERVQQCNLNDFNDSRGRTTVGPKGFEYEATPLIMLYELMESFATPGREPFYEVRFEHNAPPTSTGERTSRPVAKSKFETFFPWDDMELARRTHAGPLQYTPTSAQLFVRLIINGKEFNYPLQRLPGFKMLAEQTIIIDVVMKAKTQAQEKQDLYFDVLKALQSKNRKGYWLRSAKVVRGDTFDQLKWKTSFQKQIKPKGVKRLEKK